MVLQTFEFGNSRAKPYTAYALIILVLSIKVSQVAHSLKRASKTPANVLEPHGPSMYTLSM